MRVDTITILELSKQTQGGLSAYPEDQAPTPHICDEPLMSIFNLISNWGCAHSLREALPSLGEDSHHNTENCVCETRALLVE